MTQYKLIYFNSRGAAELSRLLFKVAGVEFEDERIEREKWESRKPEMPLGALPVLDVDGYKVTQSAAIARYLARKFGLLGANDIEELKVNELHEVCAEIIQREVMKFFYEQDATKKAELAKVFVEGPIQKYFDFFEMRLKQNNDGAGFFVGDKVTLADLAVYITLTMIDEFMKTLGADTKLSSRKLITSLIDRVEAVPNIAKWLKERPVTVM